MILYEKFIEVHYRRNDRCRQSLWQPEKEEPEILSGGGSLMKIETQRLLIRDVTTEDQIPFVKNGCRRKPK